MGFSQSTIRNARVIPDGPDLLISWDSVGPAGELYQVYVDRRLAWHGNARRCVVPSGRAGVNTWVDIGVVLPSESTQDFSATLAASSTRNDSALLRWQGGTYLDPTGGDDIQGFRIYRSPASGTAVDYGNPVDQVAAYPFGIIVDGFGKDGFGSGGFGRAASSYAWQSPPLPPGTWTFAVVPYGRSGAIPGTSPITATVTVASPPRPPSPDAGGSRLRFEYDGPASRTGTLRWAASPSA